MFCPNLNPSKTGQNSAAWFHMDMFSIQIRGMATTPFWMILNCFPKLGLFSLWQRNAEPLHGLCKNFRNWFVVCEREDKNQFMYIISKLQCTLCPKLKTREAAKNPPSTTTCFLTRTVFFCPISHNHGLCSIRMSSCTSSNTNNTWPHDKTRDLHTCPD